MTIQFDADFVWGAATSGPQAEGTFHKKHENIFDYHFHTRPQDFYHNVGPDVASNFYNDEASRRAGITNLDSVDAPD